MTLRDRRDCKTQRSRASLAQKTRRQDLGSTVTDKMFKAPVRRHRHVWKSKHVQTAGSLRKTHTHTHTSGREPAWLWKLCDCFVFCSCLCFDVLGVLFCEIVHLPMRAFQCYCLQVARKSRPALTLSLLGAFSYNSVATAMRPLTSLLVARPCLSSPAKQSLYTSQFRNCTALCSALGQRSQRTRVPRCHQRVILCQFEPTRLSQRRVRHFTHLT